MKITAYKCEDTGTIFEHLKDYQNHRARISRQLKKHSARIEKQAWLNQKWQEMCNAVSTIPELEQWVADNWDVFNENYYLHDYGDRRSKLPNLVEFKVIESRYHGDGGRLRVLLRLSAETPSFISRYFENCVLKSDGGGGSHTAYNQGFRLDSEKFHVLTTRHLLTQETTV